MTDSFDKEWNFDTNAWNPFAQSSFSDIAHLLRVERRERESGLKRFCPLAHQHFRLYT